MKTIFKFLGAILIIAMAFCYLFFKSDYYSKKFYINEKFIVVKYENYSYLIRKTQHVDTLTVANKSMRFTLIIKPLQDTLFTILDEQNYLYNQYIEQDQFFNSYQAGDTIVIKSIKKNKFWTKLSKRK
jgi:hypothetical protein